MAGKNQRDNMDWVMTELDLHHVKERDVEVRNKVYRAYALMYLCTS